MVFQWFYKVFWTLGGPGRPRGGAGGPQGPRTTKKFKKRFDWTIFEIFSLHACIIWYLWLLLPSIFVHKHFFWHTTFTKTWVPTPIRVCKCYAYFLKCLWFSFIWYSRENEEKNIYFFYAKYFFLAQTHWKNIFCIKFHTCENTFNDFFDWYRFFWLL